MLNVLDETTGGRIPPSGGPSVGSVAVGRAGSPATGDRGDGVRETDDVVSDGSGLASEFFSSASAIDFPAGGGIHFVSHLYLCIHLDTIKYRVSVRNNLEQHDCKALHKRGMFQEVGVW